MKGKRKKSLNLASGNSRCNNNCIFCIDGEKRKLPLPPAKKIFNILKQWRRRTNSVLLCGPEPTVSPYFINIVKKAKELNYTEIRLVTNGRRLSYFDFAKKIIESGITELCISFHGSCPKIQDVQTRIPGSFQQTFKGCQNISLLKSTHKFKWYINCTFNRLNASDFYNFFKMVLSFNGLNGLNVLIVLPEGRAQKHFEIVIPTYNELAKTLKKTIKRFEKTNLFKKKLSQGFELNIIGFPFCLMKGIEKYAGDYNELYLLKDPQSKIMKDFHKELDHDSIKRLQCKTCFYDQICFGIWKEYIEKRGWKEFKPVI
jgi:MoaA/NifB/PqqE/SkfB family radical SAM enzyme